MEKYSRLHDLVATVPEIELLEAPSATDTSVGMLEKHYSKLTATLAAEKLAY